MAVIDLAAIKWQIVMFYELNNINQYHHCISLVSLSQHSRNSIVPFLAILSAK